MTTNTSDRQLGWVVLAILAAMFVLPMFAMSFGVMGGGTMMHDGTGHGMWDTGDGTGWMAVGVVIQLLFLAVVVGAGYLGYRRLSSGSESADPALEELRIAYARGDLDEEEFERRREWLESNS